MSSQSNQFQLEGYTSALSLFTPAEAATMRENVERYLKDVAPGLAKSDAITARPESGGELTDQFVFLSRMDLHDAYFEALKQDPRLSDLAGDLLGGEVEVQHVQFLDIIPGVSRPTPPHQDAQFFALNPSHAVTFWIPLSEMTVDHGCLHYVPGSHWSGYLSHAKTGSLRLENENGCRDRGVAMPVKPGDLLAHHCFTVHYSAENLSGLSRWALAIHFYPKGSERLSEREWIRKNPPAA